MEHAKLYKTPDILKIPEKFLTGKVFMITGANAGIGKEITTLLAEKGATCFMVCRNPARATAARDSIAKETKNDNVHLLIGDCSLESDVRRIWNEFTSFSPGVAAGPTRLDGLICNAGVLLNDKTLTSEGVEVTFATHLLFGTYLLGTLAMPALEATPDSRLIVVSSGGMYNTKFPLWEIATSAGTAKYDGQMVYAYAKRGQVRATVTLSSAFVHCSV